MSRLDAAGRTHQGLVRPHNEDAFVCEPERGLLAVIDGMGGEAAGEVAAEITRQALLKVRHPRRALSEANAAILARGASHPGEGGMGCVATAAKLSGERLTLAHVGDTRAYLLSAAGLEQLTRDHTVVAQLAEQHGMTIEQARALPGQHRVTRDIGGHHREGLDWIDTGEVALEDGDLLLLCSDGLHDLVRDGELSRLLGAARTGQTAPERLVDELIELALSRGGHDNITVVVARYRKAPAARPPEPEAPAPQAQRTPILSLFVALLLAGVAFFVGRASAPQPEAPPPVEVTAAPAPLQWAVAEGQTLRLSGAVQAPELAVQVTLASGARLLLEDATVALEALVVTGPEDAVVEIVRTSLTLGEGEPRIDGPAVQRAEEPLESP